MNEKYSSLERKEVYEELYPETKQYSSEMMSNVRHADKTTTRQLAFNEDTSNKTGISERTIRREIQIARDIIPEFHPLFLLQKEKP